MPLNKIIKLLSISGLLLVSLGLSAQSGDRNRNFESGFISQDEKVCPAAGCRLICISYETGQAIVDKQFRQVKITQFANSDIRFRGKNTVGELDIFMSSRRASCHISS